MQANMHAFRLIHAQKHLRNLSTRLSCKYSLNPNFFPQFYTTPQRSIHFTNHLNSWTSFDSEPKKDTKVTAIYDPITGSLSTERVSNVYNNGDENNQEVPKISGDGDGGDKTYGVVKKGNLRSGSTSWKSFGAVSGGGKKKGKVKTSWVCESCGYSDGQWWGSCRSCDGVGTMKRFLEGDGSEGKMTSGFGVSEKMVQTWLPQQVGDVGPVRLTDVNRGVDQKEWRIPLSGLFGNEVARVLGGGLVPGSLVLVGGDPGVGKSTLLLQIAAIISEGHEMRQSAPVVYISGEESIEQIGNRADRMKIGTEELFLYSSTDIEDILEKTQPLSPRALIVDSIQTVFLKGVTGSPGGLSQVKECTSALLRFAKKTNIPVFLIGHVNKSGDIAGPRVLEHIIDVVLYLEGEKHSSHRLLRSVKNRFGSTDDLGVFEMSQSGLQAVPNPSEIFLSQQQIDSEVLAGLAVTVVMDGSRSFVIEIQALCVASSTNSRQVTGLQTSRADLIISVLMKQAGLKLQENGIFLNVVSGLTLSEAAGDLAVAAAICSSFLEFPIPLGVPFIAEIGLGGELRMVQRMEKRVIRVACVVIMLKEMNRSSELGLDGVAKVISVCSVVNVREDMGAEVNNRRERFESKKVFPVKEGECSFLNPLCSRSELKRFYAKICHLVWTLKCVEDAMSLVPASEDLIVDGVYIAFAGQDDCERVFNEVGFIAINLLKFILFNPSIYERNANVSSIVTPICYEQRLSTVGGPIPVIHYRRCDKIWNLSRKTRKLMNDDGVMVLEEVTWQMWKKITQNFVYFILEDKDDLKKWGCHEWACWARKYILGYSLYHKKTNKAQSYVSSTLYIASSCIF